MAYENDYAHREQGRWGGPYERRAFPPDMPMERRLGYERFSPPPPGPPRGGRFSPPPPGLRRYSPPRRSRFSPPPPRDFYPPPRRVQDEFPPQERFREPERYPPPKKQKTFHPKEQAKESKQQQGPKESPKYQKKFDQDSDTRKNEQVKESPKQTTPQQPKPLEQSPKQPATSQNKPPLPKESPKPPLPQQSPKPPLPVQTQKPPLPQQSPKATTPQQTPKAPQKVPTPAASKPTPSPQNKPQQRVANAPRVQQNAKQQHVSKFQQDPKFQLDQQFQEDTLPMEENRGGPAAQQVSNFAQGAMDTTPASQQTPQPLMSLSSQNESGQQEQQQQSSDADTPTQSRWGQKKARQKQNKKARQQQQQQQQQSWPQKQQQQQYHLQQGWQQERDSYHEPVPYNDQHQSAQQEEEPVQDETPKPRTLVQPGPIESHSSRVKKFSSRARLFIGNIQGMEDQEFQDMFAPFGEIQEPYVHKEKGFGFVRMAFKANAEAAIDALDGTVRNGRQMHVRFACSTSSVKVSNLSPYVTNELLEESFSLFGPVERAVVCTDERGRSLGYGVVDFFRKSHAQQAINRCREEFFVITRTPIPVNVSEMVQVNEDDGLPEKNIIKQHQAQMEKSVMPRFVAPGEPEHEVCLHWKVLFDSQKKKEDDLKREIDEAREAMMKESEKAAKEQQSYHMRQEIMRQREEHMRIAEDLRRQLDNVSYRDTPPEPRQYGGYDNHYGRGGEQSQWGDSRGGQYYAQQGGGAAGGGPGANQYSSPQQIAAAQYNDPQIAQLTAAAQQIQYQSQQGLYGAGNAQMIKVLDYDHTGIARPLMDSGQQ